jgi:hypothetical protein
VIVGFKTLSTIPVHLVHGVEPRKPLTVWASQAVMLIVPPAPRVLGSEQHIG